MHERPEVEGEEQEGERSQVCCCPICGGMHHLPWGAMKAKQMGRMGMGPWGMGMGPWGGGMMPWWGMRMRPIGMGALCVGPLLLGLMIGFAFGTKQHHRFSHGW